MKRLFMCICLLFGLLFSLSGCGSEAAEEPPQPIRVLCAGGAEYDWTNQILGDNPGSIELCLLVDNGMDLHSYQASAQDIADIGQCDLLIYVGGESGKWVGDALKQSTTPAQQVIVMLELVHQYGHVGHDHAVDEHVWLSLRNAEVICEEIATALSTLDPANAELYQNNASDYISKLQALDTEYQQMINSAPLHSILVADRFPFIYLVEDYGLDYAAAFDGCSAETNASFDTVIQLAAKLDEQALPAILVIEGSNADIARAVIQNSKVGNQEILVLDSLQSTTLEQIQNGRTYLAIMQQNLEALKLALSA